MARFLYMNLALFSKETRLTYESVYRTPTYTHHPPAFPNLRYLLSSQSCCHPEAMWRPMSKNLERTGFIVDQGQIEAIYKQYGLDQPAVLQYVLVDEQLPTEGRNGKILYLPTSREGRYHGTSAYVRNYRYSLFGGHLADSYPPSAFTLR